MSYPPEHKSKTHVRIVNAAARSFRESGMLATGIDQLMADAGLTRGGFYAHFRSKSALFAEVLESAFGEARENLLAKGLENKAGRAWILGATRRYVARAHRDAPGVGCAIPTLAAEVARAPDEVKTSFGKEIDGIIQAIAAHSEESKETATALLATWVGAVAMSRAVADPAQSNAIIDAVRAQIAARYAPEPAASAE